MKSILNSKLIDYFFMMAFGVLALWSLFMIFNKRTVEISRPILIHTYEYTDCDGYTRYAYYYIAKETKSGKYLLFKGPNNWEDKWENRTTIRKCKVVREKISDAVQSRYKEYANIYEPHCDFSYRYVVDYMYLYIFTFVSSFVLFYIEIKERNKINSDGLIERLKSICAYLLTLICDIYLIFQYT